MKKLTFIQIISVSMMLFAIFFGAGNMIFPPAMGQLAGTSYISALAGFILTDAGIAILGVTAVVLAGTSMSDLGNLVSRRFALVLSVGVYMLIGPLFALPRTGSVSFEIALLPYIGENNAILWSLLFTAAFFGLTYYLSSNPSRIVDVVGKYLTPVLLISILAIFIASLLQETSNGAFSFGTMMEPSPAYVDIPFFKGMIEGYNALDGPAGLAFAILVITAIRSYGVTDKKSIARYTILCGLGAAGFLAVVYFMLTYVGAITNTPFTNGGALLHAVTNHLFGGILMGVSSMYKDQMTDKANLSKAEQISKNFTQLVMQNYTMQRSVAWYAKRLGITQAHLSSIIKQTTGKTCVEIITSMVIMDAKAQLKSTNLSIHDIAYALNFTNMSFFGKYFKRHVGMSPQEYRNS